MTNLIDFIGEKIFNFNFYWTYERPVRKTMKKFNRLMDEAADIMREVAEGGNTGKETATGGQQSCDKCWTASLIPDVVIEYKQQVKESAVASTEKPENKSPVEFCENMQQFEQAVASGQQEIKVKGELYKVWKYFVRAATRKKVSRTINVSNNWFVTFGCGDGIVVLSTPGRGKNTIGVYQMKMDEQNQLITFEKIK